MRFEVRLSLKEAVLSIQSKRDVYIFHHKLLKAPYLIRLFKNGIIISIYKNRL